MATRTSDGTHKALSGRMESFHWCLCPGWVFSSGARHGRTMGSPPAARPACPDWPGGAALLRSVSFQLLTVLKRKTAGCLPNSFSPRGGGCQPEGRETQRPKGKEKTQQNTTLLEGAEGSAARVPSRLSRDGLRENTSGRGAKCFTPPDLPTPTTWAGLDLIHGKCGFPQSTYQSRFACHQYSKTTTLGKYDMSPMQSVEEAFKSVS